MNARHKALSPVTGSGGVPQAGVLDLLSRARTVSLTTYRADGSAVPTPVWHVVQDGELYLWTDPGTGKVRRIRRDARVQVTACSHRGTIRPGAPTLEGQATLLDPQDTDRVRRLLGGKYLAVRVADWFGRSRRPAIAIAVTFPTH
ncbi:PPOX class probable F420-dependent enzyme [Streptacidiphilus sp. MAP12-16]|uniref:PPOX class F420-dependent oxidoreductase n=1 Tax=Streptacidiphilus sp. MAP12-16 TaxID=3156300 RepID=UPI0035161350